MTEFETATLAIQQAALKLQEATLAIQKASLAAQQASVWVAAIVGAAQCSLIAYGLYFMRQAARHRDAQHRETMEALENRHRESMEAMDRRHRETMAEIDSRHRENMAALAEEREVEKTGTARTWRRWPNSVKRKKTGTANP